MTIYQQINETKNDDGFPVFTSEPKIILLCPEQATPTTSRVIPFTDPNGRPSA